MDTDAVHELESILERNQKLGHLRVKKRGRALTLYADAPHGADSRVKLTHLGGGQWGLSLFHHTQRWEKLPFVGSMDEVIDDLIQNFGCYLEPDP